jgi:gliding motility-associated-like protein
VILTNLSRDANQYFWDFGDGNSSRQFQPQHNFSGPGRYLITLIVRDSICDLWDTTTVEVIFEIDDFRPEVNVRGTDCADGTIELDLGPMEPHYIYEWTFSGIVETGPQPRHIFRSTDLHQFRLTIIDTLCRRTFVYDLEVEVIYEPNRLYIPNAFTPNQDGVNEFLIIGGNTCLENPRFVILSRWGEVVFETDKPFEEFWDGKHNGKIVTTDVFVYRFYTEKKSWTGTITVMK